LSGIREFRVAIVPANRILFVVTASSHVVFASKVKRRAAAIIVVGLYVVRTGIPRRKAAGK
jgi:hypothetical protein